MRLARRSGFWRRWCFFEPALLVYYSAADGPNVYAIDCDQAAHWKLISASGTLDPVANAAHETTYSINRNHTFGRFRVAHFENFDLAILVRHVDSPVYAMRLRP